jgi:hypothetical protein
VVRHRVHDGNERIKTAEKLAREHAPEDRIQSFMSDGYYVINVDGRQLVIDLRRHRYDIRMDSEIIGKYTAWDDARTKFAAVLQHTDDSTQTSERRGQ